MWFIVTHSSLQIQSQKNFDTNLSIAALKEKLYITVGTAPQDMTVELYDSKDSLISSNLDDSKLLREYPVGEYYRIPVVDNTNSATNLFNDASVEKYKISEEAYDARENTFRKWKQQQSAAGNITVTTSNTTTSNHSKAEQLEEEESKMKTLVEERQIKVGSRCEMDDELQSRGVVKFVGKTQFGTGIWVGIQLDEPMGKNNGSVKGVSYFQCEDKFGIFVKPDHVQCGEHFTERLLEELEEDEI